MKGDGEKDILRPKNITHITTYSNYIAVALSNGKIEVFTDSLVLVKTFHWHSTSLSHLIGTPLNLLSIGTENCLNIWTLEGKEIIARVFKGNCCRVVEGEKEYELYSEIGEITQVNKGSLKVRRKYGGGGDFGGCKVGGVEGGGVVFGGRLVDWVMEVGGEGGGFSVFEVRFCVWRGWIEEVH